MNFNDKIDIVKKVQSTLGITVDGVDGPKTWNAIYNFISLNYKTTTQEHNDSLPLSQSSIDLIIKYEVGGGASYYNRALKRPCWPGGASGVTIGIGYDLGYNSLSQFTSDWKSVIPAKDFSRLATTLGKKGLTAKPLISSVKDIEIPWDVAFSVFCKSTLPRFIKLTKDAFPGSEKLKPDAFGALVSLVFNRGGSVTGESRREMLSIKNAIIENKPNIYNYIGDKIIEMKRLWVGKGLDGLLTRRDEEAAVVKSCV